MNKAVEQLTISLYSLMQKAEAGLDKYLMYADRVENGAGLKTRAYMVRQGMENVRTDEQICRKMEDLVELKRQEFINLYKGAK